MTVVRIESKIEKDIQEVKYCFEEVRAQVSGGIGQYESDTEGKCRRECQLDLDTRNDMIKNVAFHLHEVTEIPPWQNLQLSFGKKQPVSTSNHLELCD